MQRRSFTLLELLISITLLSLIFLYLYRSIDSLKFSNIFYGQKANELKYQEKVLKVLYYDLMLSNKKISLLETKNAKKYSVLRIDKTRNSLYNIKNPTVIWYVSKENNTLIRLESKKNIRQLPISYDDTAYTFMDKIVTQCEAFKLYQSNDKSKLLLYLKNGVKPVVFEFNII